MASPADAFDVDVGPPSDGHPETILVALDGSRFAESVLLEVRPLARALGSRVHLVTVLDPSLSGATAGRSEECRLQMLEFERYLEELARGLREEGLRVTVEVREGEPTHEIVAAALAEDQEAELVLVHVFPGGTTGAGDGRAKRTRRAGRGGPRRDFPDPPAAGGYLRAIERRLEEPVPAADAPALRKRRPRVHISQRRRFGVPAASDAPTRTHEEPIQT